MMCLRCGGPVNKYCEGAVTDDGELICGRCCHFILMNGQPWELQSILHLKKDAKEKHNVSETKKSKRDLVRKRPLRTARPVRRQIRG